MGEVAGHSKVINSVDIRPKRPYRMITGSDDTCVSFSEGLPFKFKTTSFVSDLLFYLFVLKDVFVFIQVVGATFGRFW